MKRLSFQIFQKMFPNRWKSDGLSVNMPVCILFILVVTVFSDSVRGRSSVAVPSGEGQLTEEAAWFTSGKDEFGNTIEYFGQTAQNGKLILTASNGFFSKGIAAKGISKCRDAANGWPESTDSKKKMGHPTLIDKDYEYLGNWSQPEQTMRWHIWFPERGLVKVVLNLEPVDGNGKEAIIVSLGDQTKRTMNGDAKGHKEGLLFNVTSPGKHTLTVKAELGGESEVGRLYGIDVTGSAVENAKLLRARWRPGAVHGGYRSSTLETTSMWVMVSRNESRCSSYSPITTPFGYYGCSFGADLRSSPGMNFSMWSKKDQSLEQYAHLLAVGSPDAEFSGFGHEGTGVKPRGWEPLHARPKEVTLALRVDRGPQYDTYYGYFVDPETANWKLYCAGRKWSDKAGSKKQKVKAKSLWPGSFVEVPGSSSRQRTGDVVRTVVRKGWAIDTIGKWHRLDIMPGGKADQANKAWGVTSDGWFLLKMGGMEHFTTGKSEIRLPEKFASEKLPDFLSPIKMKQLYKLPATFGKVTCQTGKNSAQLNIELIDAGTNASAIIYYGEKDCLTYAPRKRHGTERKSSVLEEANTWPEFKNLNSVKARTTSITLTGLKPATKYYYRVLVNNDQGRMWTLETYSFTTR